jgi:hypothetical protein
MATQNQLQGGTTTSPNRAPAAKVIAGALANNRVAAALIASLGNWTMASAVVATSTSTTVNFAGLQVGDYLIHIPSSPGNVQAGIVAVAGTAPFAAVVGDLYIDLTPVNLDANNPLIPPPPAQLTGRQTGNGGTEF